MRRALIALLACAFYTAFRQLVPATSVAQSAEAPWLVVELHDQDGLALVGVPVVYHVGDVAKPARLTDSQGSVTWSISKNQGATRLHVVGWLVDAECPAGRAWINEAGEVEVRWTPGTPVVTILVRTSQFAPTATPSPGPTSTPYPTMTAGPTATAIQTEMPPADLPWVLFDIETTNIPGRVRIAWQTGNGAVAEIYSGSDSSLIEFLEGNGIETSGRARFVVYDANQLYPPTFTPGPTATASRTATPTATQQATATVIVAQTCTPHVVTATPAIWEERLEQVVRDASDMGIELQITAIYNWNDLGR